MNASCQKHMIIELLVSRSTSASDPLADLLRIDIDKPWHWAFHQTKAAWHHLSLQGYYVSLPDS